MQLGSAFKKKSGSDAESDVAADINVTPLVDVCLVMLIIFMVVTPLLRAGADVNLPQTDRPPGMPEGPKQKTISMTVRAEVVTKRSGASCSSSIRPDSTVPGW